MNSTESLAPEEATLYRSIAPAITSHFETQADASGFAAGAALVAAVAFLLGTILGALLS
jgi:hypothetical protein